MPTLRIHVAQAKTQAKRISKEILRIGENNFTFIAHRTICDTKDTEEFL